MCKESKMLSKVCSVSSHHQCYDSTLPLPPLTHTLNFSRGNRDHKEQIFKGFNTKRLSSKPASLWIHWAREGEMSTQRNHRAQVKRSHFNSVKMHCSQLSYHQLLRSECLFQHLRPDWKVCTNVKFTVLPTLKFKCLNLLVIISHTGKIFIKTYTTYNLYKGSVGSNSLISCKINY